MEKVAILGMGLSGVSCKNFFIKKNTPIVCVDKNKLVLESLKMQKIPCILEIEPMPKDITTLIVAPSIPKDHLWIQIAKKRNIPVKTEIDLGLEILLEKGKTCFGITGSNGKTSTALFLSHLLNIRGIKSLAVGNIGVSFLNHVEDKDISNFVVELSSFQLEKANKCPVMAAGAILNFSVNHLDYHKQIKEYLSAKVKLKCYLKERASFFVPQEIFSEISYVYTQKIEKFLNNILIKRDINIFPHDIYNFSVAFLLASSVYNISQNVFYEAINSFRKPNHRLEYVTEINDVIYFNDSKSTTVASVKAAVIAIGTNIIIIMGGVDKGGNFSSLVSIFKGRVKFIICFGKAAKFLYYIFSIEYLVNKTETLKEAIELANKYAKRGDIVLFSPGCASFDQFKNFEHRGNVFKELVYGLKRERVCET